jgi:hypothetical protein
MANKRKYSTLRLFNVLSKRAYKISKKRNLGWTWAEAQKWTSANIFPAYKGVTLVSRVRLTEVDKFVETKLDAPSTVLPSLAPVKKQKEVCKNPKDYASEFFEDFDWFEIVERISIFDDNMYIALELQINGANIASTGEIKKGQIPNLVSIREDIRKVVPNSPIAQIVLNIVVREGKKDDDQPCSYYVLVAFEGSDAVMQAAPKFASMVFRTKKDMTPEDLALIKEREEAIIQARKDITTKKSVKEMPRPDMVEPKPIVPKSSEEIKLEKLQAYNEAIAELKELLREGLITKKQFSKRFDDLGKNLKQGGVI